MNAFIPTSPARCVVVHPSLQQPPICARPGVSRANAVKQKQAFAIRQTPTAVSSEPLPKESLNQLVDTLLFFVRDTDRGARVTSSERDAIDSIINQISNNAPKRSLVALPYFFGDYDVAYSATTQKNSVPVGGLYRSRIGRLLFHMRALFEVFDAPDTVVNVIKFRLFGIISGAAALRGRITFAEQTGETPNVLKFEFQRPRFRLGKAVFEYGPRARSCSTVMYLDDRIRITRGKLGGTFVFVKRESTGQSEREEWKDLFSAKPLPNILLPLTAIATVATTVFAPMVVRLAVLAVIAAIAFVGRAGGTDPKSEAVIPNSNSASSA